MKIRFNLLKDNVLKNKILVENFTFLSILQIANLILFLVTIPYLFRVLGSKNYGLIIFAQTIVYYFTILINFGFNLTATRDISVNRNNSAKITEIVSSVLTIKSVFFLVSFLIMLLLTSVIDDLREERTLFLLSTIAGLSEALFPVWYFQGIEKMKYITFINVTTRIIATALVFIIIRNASGYYVYPLLLGIGTFSGAIIGLVIVFIKHTVHFQLQPLKILKNYFTENILYFFSNVSTQVYVNANKIIIGSFLGMVEVAYYDIAEKIINILRVPYSIVGQTLFPKFARDRNISFLKKMLLLTFSGTVMAVSILYFFSPALIRFFSGTVNSNSINILRILSLSLFPISISLFYGDLVLINFGLKTEYSKMRFISLVFYIVIFISLYISKQLGVYQISIMVVATELFVSIYSYLLCRKCNIL
jgi:O-antigen/teichoic acid export membrane protein